MTEWHKFNSEESQENKIKKRWKTDIFNWYLAEAAAELAGDSTHPILNLCLISGQA